MWRVPYSMSYFHWKVDPTCNKLGSWCNSRFTTGDGTWRWHSALLWQRLTLSIVVLNPQKQKTKANLNTNANTRLRACPHGGILPLQNFHPCLIFALSIQVWEFACQPISVPSPWAISDSKYVHLKTGNIIQTEPNRGAYSGSGPSKARSCGASPMCPRTGIIGPRP